MHKKTFLPVVGILLLALLGWVMSRRGREASEESADSVRNGTLSPLERRRNATLPSGSTVAATVTTRRKLTPVEDTQPFDPAAFAASPESYLGTVSPGRCFQTKQATGPDDVHLRLASEPRLELARGEKVALMVIGLPNAPVSFTSFDGGEFEESGLGSVTVRADARGIASAHFLAGVGINGDIQVQAGSPLAVGTQRFLIRASR